MDEINRNRLEEFRQFKREIRGSEEHLIVGIDIAKQRHHALLWDRDGENVFEAICL